MATHVSVARHKFSWLRWRKGGRRVKDLRVPSTSLVLNVNKTKDFYDFNLYVLIYLMSHRWAGVNANEYFSLFSLEENVYRGLFDWYASSSSTRLTGVAIERHLMNFNPDNGFSLFKILSKGNFVSLRKLFFLFSTTIKSNDFFLLSIRLHNSMDLFILI